MSTTVRRMTFAIAVVAALAATSVHAAIIRASAGLGTADFPASGVGFEAGETFYLGFRFTLDNVVQVEQVGGRIWGDTGTLFAAIVPLRDPNDSPSKPFDETTALASALFSPPARPSVDLRVPMSVKLNPGSYALVFGSEHFGASGLAAMPDDNPPLVGIEQIIHTSSFRSGWFSIPRPNGLPRFVVEGNVIPEPCTALLSSAAIAIVGSRTRHARPR